MEKNRERIEAEGTEILEQSVETEWLEKMALCFIQSKNFLKINKKEKKRKNKYY